MTQRQVYRDTSNNHQNPNKNKCALAVAAALGVADSVRYLHTMADVVRAVRTKYTTRSRLSKIGKNVTVGKARVKMSEISDKNTIGFLIRVGGHVLLADKDGKTIIDTAPRKRDCRKVKEIYILTE